MNVSTPATQGASRTTQQWPLPTLPVNVTANLEIPQKIVEAQLDAGAEFLSFVGRRLKAQADLWHSIGHCHNPAEAADAQRKFANVIIKDYSDEAQQMLSMIQKNFQTVTSLVTQSLVVQGESKAMNGSGASSDRR
jgi:hypothetical protein